MEDIIETVTEGIVSSGDSTLPPPEYTEEEMHQQTTNFLLYIVDSMKELTEQQKAKMRASILEKAFNPQELMEEITNPKKVIEPTSPQDLVVLIALVLFIVGILGKSELRRHFKYFLSIKILPNFLSLQVKGCSLHTR